MTLPDEIPVGATAQDIEKVSEIDSGKGANYIDFQVALSNLGIPVNGPITSGGLWQRVLLNPGELGGAEFHP